MKQLKLTELLSLLGYMDVRSVRRWCKKNNVFIIRQGREEFVFEPDFKKAFEIPFINNLKKQYGKDWEEVYRLHAEGDVLGLASLQVASSPARKTYKPESAIVSKYLAKYESDRKSKAA